MLKNKKIKLLVTAFLIGFAGIFSSCYYDYGIDSNQPDVVVTQYDPSYSFSSVHKYQLIDSVIDFGSGTANHSYDATIISVTRNNLNALGWTEVPATDSSANVIVMLGATTTTTTAVYGDYGWYDYWGWYPGWGYYGAAKDGYYYGGGWGWYYPWYGSGYSTYTYTTGTVITLMADPSKGLVPPYSSDKKLPLCWASAINGLVGTTTGATPTQRITTDINQAFSQSPYLK